MAKDIENPCVSLCQLNSELCVSCGRTREEIRKWRGMKRPEKMACVQKAADSTPFGHSAHADPDTCSTLIRTGSRSAATQGWHC